MILNLVLTFALGFVSVGGHIGGLLGGALAALPLFRAGDRGPVNTAIVWAIAGGLGALALFLGVSGPWT